MVVVYLFELGADDSMNVNLTFQINIPASVQNTVENDISQ